MTTTAPERRWHYRRSLASRVILLTTLAVGIAVAFVAAGAYLTVRMQLQSTLDDSLVERAQSASLDLCDPSSSVPSAYLGAADVWIVCVTGTVAVTSDKLPELSLGAPEAEVLTGDRQQSVRTIRGHDGTLWRVAAVHRESGQTMILAQSLTAEERVLRRLGVVMLSFGLAGVVAAGLAGWAVARNGLRPVRRLTAAVEDITRTEDLRPLPVEGGDEIARLAMAFNGMLVALAASRDRQRQLVADAGHELRTPLTSLRTNIDLLRQADAATDGVRLSPESRAELLEDVRAQIEELTTLVGDLVELARDEAIREVLTSVDLSEVLDHAVARVRLRAPGVRFQVTAEPWWLEGEAGALERAVTNLLDNAAKWSPPAGTVTVRLRHGVLTVDDQGAGIADQDLLHVFERFWRAEESRSLPGSGLGLSIVRQVAVRHGGSVEAGRAPGGGARLTLRLPGRPAPEPTSASAAAPVNSSAGLSTGASTPSG